MSNQQKNIALFVGFLMLLLIAYSVAIKKTIEAKTTHTKLLNDVDLLRNATGKTKFLAEKNTYLDSILQSNNVSINNSFQQVLLQKITDFTTANTIELRAFNEPHIVKEKKSSIQTYSFEVEGDFSNLLQFVNYIEQQQLGELTSINFLRKKNYRTNRYYLTVTVFLRKIINQ